MENGPYGIVGPPAPKCLAQKWFPEKEGQEHAQIHHQRIGEELAMEMIFN